MNAWLGNSILRIRFLSYHENVQASTVTELNFEELLPSTNFTARFAQLYRLSIHYV